MTVSRSVLMTCTVAPSTTAPEGSRTMPRISPVISWDHANTVTRAKHRPMSVHFELIRCPPLYTTTDLVKANRQNRRLFLMQIKHHKVRVFPATFRRGSRFSIFRIWKIQPARLLNLELVGI